MTRHDKFFMEKKAAAVLKHGVISRYPTIFASMAGKNAKEVVLYDAYAGPGRYDDGTEGSPLLAVRTALSTASFRNVRLVFSEEDIDNHTNLHAVLTEEAGDAFPWEAIPGDVEHLARAIVAEAGESPMLTFLDPFGVGLSYEVLTDTLLRRPESLRTEVLLNINIESVRRIGGRLAENDGHPGPSAEATLRRVDRFLGDDWWRGDFRSVRERSTERTAARAASHVIDEFCRRVKANTGFSSFQVPIRRRPGQVPLFILTLFYRHRVAPWKFNGCASSANADWRKACMVEDLERDLSSIAVAQSLFGEDGTEQLMREEREKAWEAQEVKLSDEWVSTIAGNLEGLLARHGSVNLADNVKAVYGDTLGLARDKHVTRAWDRLTEAGLAFPRVKKTRLEYATVQRGA